MVFDKTEIFEKMAKKHTETTSKENHTRKLRKVYKAEKNITHKKNSKKQTFEKTDAKLPAMKARCNLRNNEGHIREILSMGLDYVFRLDRSVCVCVCVC